MFFLKYWKFSNVNFYGIKHITAVVINLMNLARWQVLYYVAEWGYVGFSECWVYIKRWPQLDSLRLGDVLKTVKSSLYTWAKSTNSRFWNCKKAELWYALICMCLCQKQFSNLHEHMSLVYASFQLEKIWQRLSTILQVPNVGDRKVI